MHKLQKTHPLGELEYSNDNSDVVITICEIPALVNLFAKKEQDNAVMKKLGFNTGPGQVAETGPLKALPLAPNQWVLVSKKDTAAVFARKISEKIEGIGYVSEQSESRVCIRISGPKAHELMSRGCRLDLHPSAVSAGYCAQTTMAQIGVLLHVVDDQTYELYIYSGFARSFWHWITETARQFGSRPQ